MKRPTRMILAAGFATLAAAAALVLGAQRGSFDRDNDMKSFDKEDVRKTLRFADPSRPGELIVDNLFGPVTVEGYAGKDVILEASRIVYARDEARARKAGEEVTLDITVRGNTIEAYVDGPFRENEGPGRERSVQMRRDPGYRVYYGFTLKVPARTNLVLSTVLDGDIEVRGVEGTFDVRNVVGQVRLVDAAGSGEARAVSGGVTVLFRRHPDGPCSFKSVSGDVEIDFPGEPSADFRFKTMHGEVYSDFDVTRLPKAAPVREERRDGDGKFIYRSDGFIGVRAGRGGPEIKLETLTGDILIARRSK